MEVLRAYGLTVGLPFAVPGSHAGDAWDVQVLLVPSREELRAAWSGPGEKPLVAHRWVDGRPLDYHRGPAGDSLLLWGGEDGAWLLDPERRSVRAHSPTGEPEAAWLRVLLDSVLASVALGRGAEALHAGAVVVGEGAVGILGATGAGKTSLVAALLARGHALLADDIVVLAGTAGEPAPPVMSLAAERATANGGGRDAAAAIGEPLAVLGDEIWIRVRRVATAAVPLRALVVLDRRAGAPATARLEPDSSPFAALFGHVLHSGDEPARERARFGAVAAVAAEVPVWRLVAPLDGATPAELAELVEAL